MAGDKSKVVLEAIAHASNSLRCGMDKDNQESNESGSGKIWAWIGKAAVLITIPVAVLQLFVGIWPSGPKLEAKCLEYDFSVPPDLLTILKRELNYPRVDDLIPVITNHFNALDPEFARKVEQLANGLQRERRMSNDYYSPWHRQTIVTIRNTGDRAAQNIVLPLSSSDGVALIACDGNAETKKAAGSISLGALRPKGEISVFIWSVGGVLPYGSDAVLSHGDGAVSIKRPEILYGFAGQIGAIVKTLTSSPFLVIFLALLIVPELLLIFYGLNTWWKSSQRRSRKNANSVEKP